MKRLSQFILVVACIHSIHKDASKILAEYLEGIPHIKREGKGSFTGTTCYVIKNSAGFHIILEHITSSKDACRVMGYGVYERLPSKNLGITLYQKYHFSSTSNISYLPTHIGIADSDLDKFISITRG